MHQAPGLTSFCLSVSLYLSMSLCLCLCFSLVFEQCSLYLLHCFLVMDAILTLASLVNFSSSRRPDPFVAEGGMSGRDALQVSHLQEVSNSCLLLWSLTPFSSLELQRNLIFKIPMKLVSLFVSEKFVVIYFHMVTPLLSGSYNLSVPSSTVVPEL